MKTRYTYPAAALFAAALIAQPTAQSQTTPAAPRPQGTPQAQGADANERMSTFEGCLYRERDIPGRAPNVAERAGILEDYILADARMAPAQGAASDRPGAASDRPATGAAVTGRMYEVVNIDDERLQTFVGKRVRVTGTVDRSDAEANNVEDLAEIEATAISAADGTCPATPAAAAPANRS
ncbi:MAG: hypothetical protein HOP14_10090 [Acidobacteria bacterium]|nr:hypothetical protein [Acidobacteriota bacterium]